MAEYIFNYKEKEVGDRQSSLNLQEYDCVLVIGVGGIGSWVVLDLALSNKVSTIVVYDDDQVEATNLNRTPFRIKDIGFDKVIALKSLVVERRWDVTIKDMSKKFSKSEFDFLKASDLYPSCIIDCRDDVFNDLKDFKGKVWKIGYDGLEITIDGNPNETKVWGNQRGYQVIPSFVCSSQLAANLVVNHILIPNLTIFGDKFEDSDENGKFNGIVTFNSATLLYDINSIEKQRENSEWQ